MPCKIENLTLRPVLLSLTSGQTLRLSPRATSSELWDVEVKNNPKIQKLQEQRVIALHKVKQKGDTPVHSQVEKRKDTPPGSKK